ncbi:MAG: hypothetical protein L6R39_003864 [Caloplaca ligustica]|nr:MAG: hypothetical protein L6R39_003864 [Caloplaca ligustica]
MDSIIATTDLRESPTAAEESQINLARAFDSISTVYDQKIGDVDTRQRNSETVSQEFTKMKDWQRAATYRIGTMTQNDDCHLRDITEDTKVLDWEFFHEIYVGLDNGKLVEKTMDTIEAGNRKFQVVGGVEEDAKYVRPLCDEYRSAVRAAALHLMESLCDKKHRRNLVYSIVSRQEDPGDEAAIAHWLRQLFNGEKHVQETMARLTAAWKDALSKLADLSKPKATQIPLR